MREFCLILLLGLIGYLAVRAAHRRREESLREDERKSFRRMIAQDARNVGAHEALGDSFRRGGRLAEAREAYLQALEASGGQVPDEGIRYKLRQADLALRERIGDRYDPNADLTLCPQCGDANPPHQRVCQCCGVTLPYDTFREALRDPEVRRTTYEAAACGIVLWVTLWVFNTLPLDVKGVLIMSTVIVVSWRLLQAIGPRRL